MSLRLHGNNLGYSQWRHELRQSGRDGEKDHIREILSMWAVWNCHLSCREVWKKGKTQEQFPTSIYAITKWLLKKLDERVVPYFIVLLINLMALLLFQHSIPILQMVLKALGFEPSFYIPLLQIRVFVDQKVRLYSRGLVAMIMVQSIHPSSCPSNMWPH